MSTIIIITTPPKREQSQAEKTCGDSLKKVLQSTVDNLRELGYDVEVQHPET